MKNEAEKELFPRLQFITEQLQLFIPPTLIRLIRNYEGSFFECLNRGVLRQLEQIYSLRSSESKFFFTDGDKPLLNDFLKIIKHQKGIDPEMLQGQYIPEDQKSAGNLLELLRKKEGVFGNTAPIHCAKLRLLIKISVFLSFKKIFILNPIFLKTFERHITISGTNTKPPSTQKQSTFAYYDLIINSLLIGPESGKRSVCLDEVKEKDKVIGFEVVLTSDEKEKLTIICGRIIPEEVEKEPISKLLVRYMDFCQSRKDSSLPSIFESQDKLNKSFKAIEDLFKFIESPEASWGQIIEKIKTVRKNNFLQDVRSKQLFTNINLSIPKITNTSYSITGIGADFGYYALCAGSGRL